MSLEQRTVCARVKSASVVASSSNEAARAAGGVSLGKMLRCTVASAPVDFFSAAVDFCSASDAYAVEEADSGRQVNFVTRRTFRRSATASLCAKIQTVSKEKSKYK